MIRIFKNENMISFIDDVKEARQWPVGNIVLEEIGDTQICFTRKDHDQRYVIGTYYWFNIGNESGVAEADFADTLTRLNGFFEFGDNTAVIGEIKTLLEQINTLIGSIENTVVNEGIIRLADNDTHDLVSVTDSATLLMPANTSRRKLVITNISNKVLYVKKGGGITTTNWSYRISKGSVNVIEDYRGAVYGILDTGTENIQVNETY
jgi:hypothetical protein